MNKSSALLSALIIGALSCSDSDEPVPGPHRIKSEDVGYFLNNEANVLTETVIRETFEKWAEVTGIKFQYMGRNRAGLLKDGKNTVSFLLRWPADVPISKVAYCKSWYDSSGNIIESDLIFNMQVARFTTLRTNKPDSYYIEGVLSHEIGHMIGLEHTDSPHSLMKSKSDITESYFKGVIDRETITAYRRLYGFN